MGTRPVFSGPDKVLYSPGDTPVTQDQGVRFISTTPISPSLEPYRGPRIPKSVFSLLSCSFEDRRRPFPVPDPKSGRRYQVPQRY